MHNWTKPSPIITAATRARAARDNSSLSSLGYSHAAPDPLSDPAVFDDINAFSEKKQTGISLKTLLDTGL